MGAYLKDIFAAVAVVFNAIPMAMFSLSYGFAAFPTALGFIVGGLGMLLTHQIAPISLQAESIVLAGTISKDRNERLNIIFFSGIVMVVMGLLGLLTKTMDFIGPCVLSAMLAGVGLMLAKAGFDMIKQNKLVAGVSMASALLTYFVFTKNDLIWTIAVSVVVSTIAHLIRAKVTGDMGGTLEVDMSKEKLIPLKLTVNPHVIRSVLAVCTLQIGGNIAYATITAGLAGSKANVDAITVYSGLADSASSFFGGGPVEAIISGTAVAPHPLLAGIILVAIVAAILLTKTITKIAKYIPAQTISGFLFTLGAFAVFAADAPEALKLDPIVGSVVIIVTSFSDPFIGMVCGVVLKYVLKLTGA